MKKDRIAWECLHCGHRHLWKWERWEATDGQRIIMICDRCERSTRGRLAEIGTRVYALTGRVTYP